jgi:hypothetical protein
MNQMARKPAFFWCVVVLGAALAICYAAAGVQFWRHASESKIYGWYRGLYQGSWYVTWVQPGGPADGILKVNDRIAAYEGRTGVPWLVDRIVMLTPPGGNLRLTIVRGGRRLEVAVPVRRVRTPVEWTMPMLAASSVVCFLVAMLMGLSKPGDRTVQLGFLTFITIAALQLSTSLLPIYWMLDGWGRVLYGLLDLSNPLPVAFGYLFAARFPKKIESGPWWKLLAALVCAAVGLEALLMLPDRVLSTLNAEWSVALEHTLRPLLAPITKVPMAVWKADRVLVLAGIAAVLVRNYRALPQPDMRRRIRWLVCGMLAALAPSVVLYAGAALHAVTGFGFRTDTWRFYQAEYAATSFLGVVAALAITHGVLQHRLLDIHVVIRRSIQYLLATHVLQAAIFLPVLLLVLRAVLNPQLTVRGLLFGSYFYLALAAAAALGLAYRRTLLLAVDRRFFREQYNQEQILRTLIEEIKDRDSVSEVSRLVSAKLQDALHPRRILVFYRSEPRGDFRLGHSSGGLEPELRVNASSPLLKVLEAGAAPRDFPFSDEGGEPSPETEYLEKLGVCLLAPVTGADRRLVGLLMLGEKRSESPYSGTDRSLLQAIAAQIGVVYENIALRESARREAQIKRDVLAHLNGAEINLLKECPRCGTCFDRAAAECPNDGAALSLTLPVDRTVDGVYRLDRRIGTGAMGAVYRATDLRLGRPVAVKLMVGSLFGNRAALRRFEREARAVARLSHPNIVAIHDFGAVAADGAYLVMELIEGQTLRSELRSSGLLEPPLAAARIGQLLEGLCAAHAHGVVHRDLKPENVIVARLTGGGELVKLLDFGLAKVAPGEGPEHASLTLAGTVVGTMGYMSPEQLLGEEVDERADTFAAGVLAAECLTGRRPFAGLSFQELLHATLHQPVELPGDDPPIRRLNAVLARCLARNPRGPAASRRDPPGAGRSDSPVSAVGVPGPCRRGGGEHYRCNPPPFLKRGRASPGPKVRFAATFSTSNSMRIADRGVSAGAPATAWWWTTLRFRGSTACSNSVQARYGSRTSRATTELT